MSEEKEAFEIKSWYITVEGITTLKVIAIDERINIVGSCQCHMMEYYGYLQDLFVYGDQRRKGIATKLVNYVFDICRSNNIGACSFIVEAENMVAREFYEQFGFFICDDLNDGLLMTMRIPENGV